MTSHIDDRPSNDNSSYYVPSEDYSPPPSPSSSQPQQPQPSSSFKEQVQIMRQPPKDPQREQLISELENQRDSVKDKGSHAGGRHDQKTNVLQAAIDVLRNKQPPSHLTDAIRENPRYDEAPLSFKKSTTQNLIERTQAMAPDTSLGLKK
jgi:hypothetical protein